MELPGKVNGHIVGVSMKEAVRRAMVEVRKQRFSFEAEEKATDYKSKQDFVTTADKAAQACCARILREHFPTYGIVAEEDNLAVPCTEPGRDLWFTLDPLDGTKAYIRRQSHGIGTMVSLVDDGEIIAAYVGDVMTQEIYGYRPGSNSVWRISDWEHWEKLNIDVSRSLATQYVLLRDGPDVHSQLVQELVKATKNGGVFEGVEVSGGSFGIGMARLWKGEVGAAVLRPTMQTPWDLLPPLGISQKLGFVFLELDEESGGNCRVIQMPVSKEKVQTEKEILVIHSSRVVEFNQWKDEMAC